MSSTDSGFSEYFPVLANQAFWDEGREILQRKGLAQPWCPTVPRDTPLPPERDTVEHLLLLLSEATSTEALQNIITAHAFYCHRVRERIPSVVLKNDFRYTLPFQTCGIYKCSSRGLHVRRWSPWLRRHGWHPPMSPETKPATMLQAPPVPRDSFGPSF